MIEINLVPDVKLELLKANRQRKMVISASILISIAAGALVVVMGVYAFGVQTVADSLADNAIESESAKLRNIEDLSKTLTIQSQLSQLKTDQSNKNITSRLFDIINVTVPTGENEVVIKRLAFNSEDKTVEIEAEAENGYEALEVFKKTIAETQFDYTVDGERQDAVKISESIEDGERRYTEDSDGKQVLRFSLAFTYNDALFTPDSQNGRVIGPNTQSVTDSARGVPTSLFNGGSE